MKKVGLFHYFIISLLFIMNACTSDPVSSLEEIKVKQSKKTTAKNDANSVSSLTFTTNPLSVENVENALKQLGRNDVLDKDKIYHYYKLDPASVTGDMLAVIEKDSTHHILDYPFADAKIYNDEFGENFEQNIETLKDGNLYIVFKTGTDLENMISSSSELKAEKLDELYLPQDDDEQLLEYLINQNSSEERLLPCLLKRPRGRVRYQDQETGFMRPVPNIQVWALVFGIPVATWTDAQGNYAIPYRFSAGTFIGTHAKNGRINVKPFNTTGGFFSVVPQLVSNFIIGSVHNAGWYNACRMRDDINIDFNVHGQPRYWAQILDMVRWHDIYTKDFNRILSAPYGLTWYAHWADARGNASAPMLGQLNPLEVPNLTDVIGFQLGINLNPIQTNLTSILKGLPPDITTRQSNIQDNNYSERFAQTSFHELAHASFFRKVGGAVYWVPVITGIVFGGCGTYGCEGAITAGHIQLNEAWAEYLGKEHHRLFHPNGQTVIIQRGRVNRWESYPLALEAHDTFSPETWIPTGVFYDYVDGFNPVEGVSDNVSGFTIEQMYNAFSPFTVSICTYQNRLLQMYPSRITEAQANAILRWNAPTLNCNPR